MSDRPDLRTESDRTPGPYKRPVERGDYRNIYRRADGSERHGCTWHDPASAEAMREALDGETFVELRDMRDATSMALVGVSGAAEGSRG